MAHTEMKWSPPCGGCGRRRFGVAKRLVLPGATAKAAYWTWRVAPGGYERLVRSRVK